MYDSSSTSPGIKCITSDWNKFYTMLLSYRFQMDFDELKNKVIIESHINMKSQPFFTNYERNLFSLFFHSTQASKRFKTYRIKADHMRNRQKCI